MMTQSVMTQAANLFGNASGSVTTKGKQAESGFGLLIDSSMKAAQNTSGSIEDMPAKKTSVPNLDNPSSNRSASNSAVDAQTKTVDADQGNAAVSAKSADQTSKTNQADTAQGNQSAVTLQTDEQKVDEKVLSEIAGLLQSLQEIVMKALNLTPEEFNQLLSEQKMSLADLLQPEKLQQLILAGNGQTDILAALTDENLADTINQLMKTVEEMKSSSELKLTAEQMKSILAQAEAKSDSMTEAAMDMAAASEQKTSRDEPVEQSETLKTSDKSDGKDEKSISKTVAGKEASTEITKTADVPENNAKSHTDAGAKDNKDLKPADQFQNFVDNLVKSSQETKVDFSGNMVQLSEIREIANQIIERIKVSVTPEKTSMELQLNPDNLGKVNLSVQSRNGVMTAQFVVQNEISKEAIESQMHTLRETLNQQGIKVEAIEVTVLANAFEQNSNQSQGEQQTDTRSTESGKHITLEEAINMTEEPETDTSTKDITGIRGSQIDYTA